MRTHVSRPVGWRSCHSLWGARLCKNKSGVSFYLLVVDDAVVIHVVLRDDHLGILIRESAARPRMRENCTIKAGVQ